jgi:amino acid permease
VAGASLVLALISWLIVIIKGDEIIRGWVIMSIGMVLISVLLCYSLMARWFNRVLLNVINPISFK